MNAAFLVAGALAAFMVVGHSTLGRRQFFLPMLAADFDPTSKRIMEFVWHMSTLTLVAAAVALIFAGLAADGAPGRSLLALFVGLLFLASGAVHLYLVVTSQLPGDVVTILKMDEAKRSAKQKQRLQDHYLSLDESLTALKKKKPAALTMDVRVIKQRATRRKTHLFRRGDFTGRCCSATPRRRRSRSRR